MPTADVEVTLKFSGLQGWDDPAEDIAQYVRQDVREILDPSEGAVPCVKYRSAFVGVTDIQVTVVPDPEPVTETRWYAVTLRPEFTARVKVVRTIGDADDQDAQATWEDGLTNALACVPFPDVDTDNALGEVTWTDTGRSCEVGLTRLDAEPYSAYDIDYA